MSVSYTSSPDPEIEINVSCEMSQVPLSNDGKPATSMDGTSAENKMSDSCKRGEMMPTVGLETRGENVTPSVGICTVVEKEEKDALNSVKASSSVDQHQFVCEVGCISKVDDCKSDERLSNIDRKLDYSKNIQHDTSLSDSFLVPTDPLATFLDLSNEEEPVRSRTPFKMEDKPGIATATGKMIKRDKVLSILFGTALKSPVGVAFKCSASPQEFDVIEDGNINSDTKKQILEERFFQRQKCLETTFKTSEIIGGLTSQSKNSLSCDECHPCDDGRNSEGVEFPGSSVSSATGAQNGKGTGSPTEASTCNNPPRDDETPPKSQGKMTQHLRDNSTNLNNKSSISQKVGLNLFEKAVECQSRFFIHKAEKESVGKFQVEQETDGKCSSSKTEMVTKSKQRTGTILDISAKQGGSIDYSAAATASESNSKQKEPSKEGRNVSCSIKGPVVAGGSIGELILPLRKSELHQCKKQPESEVVQQGDAEDRCSVPLSKGKKTAVDREDAVNKDLSVSSVSRRAQMLSTNGQEKIDCENQDKGDKDSKYMVDNDDDDDDKTVIYEGDQGEEDGLNISTPEIMKMLDEELAGHQDNTCQERQKNLPKEDGEDELEGILEEGNGENDKSRTDQPTKLKSAVWQGKSFLTLDSFDVEKVSSTSEDELALAVEKEIKSSESVVERKQEYIDPGSKGIQKTVQVKTGNNDGSTVANVAVLSLTDIGSALKGKVNSCDVRGPQELQDGENIVGSQMQLLSTSVTEQSFSSGSTSAQNGSKVTSSRSLGVRSPVGRSSPVCSSTRTELNNLVGELRSEIKRKLKEHTEKVVKGLIKVKGLKYGQDGKNADGTNTCWREVIQIKKERRKKMKLKRVKYRSKAQKKCQPRRTESLMTFQCLDDLASKLSKCSIDHEVGGMVEWVSSPIKSQMSPMKKLSPLAGGTKPRCGLSPRTLPFKKDFTTTMGQQNVFGAISPKGSVNSSPVSSSWRLTLVKSDGSQGYQVSKGDAILKEATFVPSSKEIKEDGKELTEKTDYHVNMATPLSDNPEAREAPAIPTSSEVGESQPIMKQAEHISNKQLPPPPLSQPNLPFLFVRGINFTPSIQQQLGWNPSVYVPQYPILQPHWTTRYVRPLLQPMMNYHLVQPNPLLSLPKLVTSSAFSQPYHLLVQKEQNRLSKLPPENFIKEPQPKGKCEMVAEEVIDDTNLGRSEEVSEVGIKSDMCDIGSEKDEKMIFEKKGDIPDSVNNKISGVTPEGKEDVISVSLGDSSGMDANIPDDIVVKSVIKTDSSSCNLTRKMEDGKKSVNGEMCDISSEKDGKMTSEKKGNIPSSVNNKISGVTLEGKEDVISVSSGDSSGMDAIEPDDIVVKSLIKTDSSSCDLKRKMEDGKKSVNGEVCDISSEKDEKMISEKKGDVPDSVNKISRVTPEAKEDVISVSSGDTSGMDAIVPDDIVVKPLIKTASSCCDLAREMEDGKKSMDVEEGKDDCQEEDVKPNDKQAVLAENSVKHHTCVVLCDQSIHPATKSEYFENGVKEKEVKMVISDDEIVITDVIHKPDQESCVTMENSVAPNGSKVLPEGGGAVSGTKKVMEKKVKPVNNEDEIVIMDVIHRPDQEVLEKEISGAPNDSLGIPDDTRAVHDVSLMTPYAGKVQNSNMGVDKDMDKIEDMKQKEIQTGRTIVMAKEHKCGKNDGAANQVIIIDEITDIDEGDEDLMDENLLLSSGEQSVNFNRIKEVANLSVVEDDVLSVGDDLSFDDFITNTDNILAGDTENDHCKGFLIKQKSVSSKVQPELLESGGLKLDSTQKCRTVKEERDVTIELKNTRSAEKKLGKVRKHSGGRKTAKQKATEHSNGSSEKKRGKGGVEQSTRSIQNARVKGGGEREKKRKDDRPKIKGKAGSHQKSPAKNSTRIVKIVHSSSRSKDMQSLKKIKYASGSPCDEIGGPVQKRMLESSSPTSTKRTKLSFLPDCKLMGFQIPKLSSKEKKETSVEEPERTNSSRNGTVKPVARCSQIATLNPEKKTVKINLKNAVVELQKLKVDLKSRKKSGQKETSKDQRKVNISKSKDSPLLGKIRLKDVKETSSHKTHSQVRGRASDRVKLSKSNQPNNSRKIDKKTRDEKFSGSLPPKLSKNLLQRLGKKLQTDESTGPSSKDTSPQKAKFSTKCRTVTVAPDKRQDVLFDVKTDELGQSSGGSLGSDNYKDSKLAGSYSDSSSHTGQPNRDVSSDDSTLYTSSRKFWRTNESKLSPSTEAVLHPGEIGTPTRSEIWRVVDEVFPSPGASWGHSSQSLPQEGNWNDSKVESSKENKLEAACSSSSSMDGQLIPTICPSQVPHVGYSNSGYGKVVEQSEFDYPAPVTSCETAQGSPYEQPPTRARHLVTVENHGNIQPAGNFLLLQESCSLVDSVGSTHIASDSGILDKGATVVAQHQETYYKPLNVNGQTASPESYNIGLPIETIGSSYRIQLPQSRGDSIGAPSETKENREFTEADKTRPPTHPPMSSAGDVSVCVRAQEEQKEKIAVPDERGIQTPMPHPLTSSAGDWSAPFKLQGQSKEKIAVSKEQGVRPPTLHSLLLDEVGFVPIKPQEKGKDQNAVSKEQEVRPLTPVMSSAGDGFTPCKPLEEKGQTLSVLKQQRDRPPTPHPLVSSAGDRSAPVKPQEENKGEIAVSKEQGARPPTPHPVMPSVEDRSVSVKPQEGKKGMVAESKNQGNSKLSASSSTQTKSSGKKMSLKSKPVKGDKRFHPYVPHKLKSIKLVHCKNLVVPTMEELMQNHTFLSPQLKQTLPPTDIFSSPRTDPGRFSSFGQLHHEETTLKNADEMELKSVPGMVTDAKKNRVKTLDASILKMAAATDDIQKLLELDEMVYALKNESEPSRPLRAHSSVRYHPYM